EASPEIISLQRKLSDLAGKEVNYFSLQAYENERDHIGWHQHREDKCRDARVFITSLGECRSFGVQVFDLNAVASKANRRAGGLESSRTNCTFIPEQRLRLAMRSRPAWVTYQLPCSRITSPAETERARSSVRDLRAAKRGLFRSSPHFCRASLRLRRHIGTFLEVNIVSSKFDFSREPLG